MLTVVVCKQNYELFSNYFISFQVSPAWDLTFSQDTIMDFPGGSVVKNLPAKARDIGSIPGSGTSPGEGNGNPLQYSCLENFKDRGAWWATVQGGSQSV